MHVSAILKEKGNQTITIGPNASIADAANLLAAEKIGALMVTDEAGGVVGILSERDIVRGLSSKGLTLMTQLVSELMTTTVVTCEPEADLEEMMRDMTSHRIRHLPVVDDGQLTGVISIGDVVKYRLDELEAESSQLREYIERG